MWASPSAPLVVTWALGKTRKLAARLSGLWEYPTGLPKAFANATVIIEQLSDNELRIRKARVIPEDELRFSEEAPIVLSDRERARFLDTLDNLPKPKAALRRLMGGKAKKRV